MKVTFLGTGTSQGVPIIACPCSICASENPKDKRLRSSIMLETDSQVFVIDSTPDFRYQMLRENVKQLDALIFTHEHKDHTGGLDDIRAFNYINKRPTEIYATLRVQENLIKSYDYIFENSSYPGVPQLNFHTIDARPFSIENTLFQPIEVLHHKLPVLGFRIKDFAYITDANFIPEEEFEKLKGLKVLVLNALRLEKHISHFTLAEAIKIAERIGAEKTYFTHISHQLGLHDIVSKDLPQNQYLAYDGLKLSFNQV